MGIHVDPQQPAFIAPWKTKGMPKASFLFQCLYWLKKTSPWKGWLCETSDSHLAFARLYFSICDRNNKTCCNSIFSDSFLKKCDAHKMYGQRFCVNFMCMYVLRKWVDSYHHKGATEVGCLGMGLGDVASAPASWSGAVLNATSVIASLHFSVLQVCVLCNNKHNPSY